MTPDEASAFWTELERALQQVDVLRQPPPWRRRRTGELRVTLTEKRAMQALHLLRGETYTALAKMFRRNRHYVPRWIWTPQYRAFHAFYWGTNESAQPTSRSREAVLQVTREVPPREAGDKLRPSDELRILVMVKEQGVSQEVAAESLGCHQSTVSRVLAKYDDTRPLARKRLEAAALEVAERAIREGDPLKLLAKLDVVREDKDVGSNPSVVINIGAPGKPIRLPDIEVPGD